MSNPQRINITPAAQSGSGSTWNRTKIDDCLVRVATRIEPN